MKKILFLVVVGVLVMPLVLVQAQTRTNSLVPNLYSSEDITKQNGNEELRRIQEERQVELKKLQEEKSVELQKVRVDNKADIQQDKDNYKADKKDFVEGFKSLNPFNKEEIKTPEERKEAIEQIQEKKDMFREEAIENREEFKMRIEAKKENAKEVIQERREEIKQTIIDKKEAHREAFKEKLEEAKQKREEARENMKIELQAKVEDERKITAVENIDTYIGEVNQKITGQFTAHVDGIEELLGKLDTRADTATASGLDTTAFYTYRDTVEAAVLAARTAIETQAGQVYEIVIDDEDSLKGDVSGVKEELHNDLQGVKSELDNLKNIIRGAIGALQSVPRVDEAEVE